MLAKTLSIMAVLAFAAQVSASEPMPYKPQLMKMSVRDLFGFERRQTSSGYQPAQSVCGSGDTCAEACGAGYTECPSGDDMTHCYDLGASQTCCPDGSGNSCDAGYFCAADTVHGTWCCPDGMSLAACAAAYSVTGGLVSETATPTSTSSTSTSTSSVAPTTTSAVTTSTATTIASAFSVALNTTVTALVNSTLTTSCSESVGASATFPASNGTLTSLITTKPTVTGPTATPSKVATNAGSAAAPAGALLAAAALAAGAWAALL